MDEQYLAEGYQYALTLLRSLQAHYPATTGLIEDRLVMLEEERQRLRTGLQYIADADCDVRFCLCGGVAYDVLAGQPLPG